MSSAARRERQASSIGFVPAAAGTSAATAPADPRQDPVFFAVAYPDKGTEPTASTSVLSAVHLNGVR